MKTFLYLLIGLVCFCQCADNKSKIRNDYELEELEDKCFVLDENTIQTSSSFQYISEKDWFCFINEPDNSITINDFNTGKFIKKIYFDKEGSNGVGTISSFCIKDSLIYLHHHWNRMLYITNLNAHVLQRIPIDLDDFYKQGITLPSILPSESSPIQIVKDKLVLTGFQWHKEGTEETGQNMPSTVLYDLDKQRFELTNGYPELYHKGQWGFNLRMIYYTVNEKDEIVVSYPASDSIFVNDLNGYIISYYAGLKNGNGIKPIARNLDPRDYSQDKELEHYMKNTVYSALLYDRERELYYRLVSLPTEINKSNKENPYNKKLQFIILDKNYQEVGLVDLPEYVYWSARIFISKEGIHIQIPSDNDDIMRFKTFKVKKKK
ncbi:hypothetical protein B5F77_15280 [Parabacteroides sp. An277]|uniref:DUF4221 family protein n=1 Tax=Parabacteroides sp. An277 TaxID=1965619 RepID=UPI000B385B85|nr:DUF4221 family protein [Parabacteroides sp. An277]OUO49184.1 hypothetical protein B5F77_15280 [Parabacteroides sp. An277]